MSQMKPTTSTDPDDRIDVSQSLANCVQIDHGVKYLINRFAYDRVLDLSEGGPIWDTIKQLSDELGELSKSLWPGGIGPESNRRQVLDTVVSPAQACAWVFTTVVAPETEFTHEQSEEPPTLVDYLADIQGVIERIILGDGYDTLVPIAQGDSTQGDQ